MQRKSGFGAAGLGMSGLGMSGLGMSGLGISGLIAGCGLWMFSAFCLAVAMHYNLDASDLSRGHGLLERTAVARLHGVAVGWAGAFTFFQLAGFLVFTFVFRAAWRLRAAVCFTLGAGLVMVGDCVGLVCLLVWLRLTLGSS